MPCGWGCQVAESNTIIRLLRSPCTWIGRFRSRSSGFGLLSAVLSREFSSRCEQCSADCFITGWEKSASTPAGHPVRSGSVVELRATKQAQKWRREMMVGFQRGPHLPPRRSLHVVKFASTPLASSCKRVSRARAHPLKLPQHDQSPTAGSPSLTSHALLT